MGSRVATSFPLRRADGRWRAGVPRLPRLALAAGDTWGETRERQDGFRLRKRELQGETSRPARARDYLARGGPGWLEEEEVLGPGAAPLGRQFWGLG